MRRAILFSFLAFLALTPGTAFATPGKDAKKGDKEDKSQTQDQAKSQKTKPGPPTDDIEVGKKKPKSRVLPTTPPPSARPQNDDPGDILWDTEFLVRSTIPMYPGTLVYTKY